MGKKEKKTFKKKLKINLKKKNVETFGESIFLEGKCRKKKKPSTVSKPKAVARLLCSVIVRSKRWGETKKKKKKFFQ